MKFPRAFTWILVTVPLVFLSFSYIFQVNNRLLSCTDGLWSEEGKTKAEKNDLIPPIKQWYLDRGTNLLTSHTGCFIARWSYIGALHEKGTFERGARDDCELANPLQIMNSTNVHEVRDWDTVYVTFPRLQHWILNCGSKLLVRGTKIVLIIGEGAASGKNIFKQVETLLSYKNVMHIFCMDTKFKCGGHSKIKPWPLGLSYQKHPHPGYDPLGDYRKVFLENIPFVKKKTKNILIAYLTTTSHGSRKSIPHTDKRTRPEEFFRLVASSRFVMSPNGLRPECHRHYEALGLGAIPITSLDPQIYWNLKDGPVIFNVTNWDIESLTTELEDISSGLPAQANRNMIFEEYWMEFVEGIVGRDLIWWDRLSGEPRKMQDFDLVSTPMSTSPAPKMIDKS